MQHPYFTRDYPPPAPPERMPRPEKECRQLEAKRKRKASEAAL